ncbi:hypothetical protein GCM10023187_14940 [Nibrella viscosa]|uniref:histidine kinase n=1 Tax=Nibrella viscosa TaxID=1084524 RepID=A0ABP8K6G8_9BACT
MRFLIFWIWLASVGFCFGQIPILFDQLTTADGLPENAGYAMLQDRQGFVWLATRDGLVRYDGINMIIYRNNPNDPFSYKGHFTHALKEDSAGDIWIGSDHGLTRFERATGRFIDCSPTGKDRFANSRRVFTVHIDQSGNIWIVSSGRITIENWLSLTIENWLSRYQPKTGQWTHYRHNPANAYSLAHDNIQSHFVGTAGQQMGLYEDRAGRIWVSTRLGGLPDHDAILHRYDAKNDRFIRVTRPENDPDELAFRRVNVPVADRSGLLWVPTRGHGLYRINPVTLAVEQHYRYKPNQANSLSSDSIRVLYQDRAGYLWITTAKGLDRMHPDRQQITHFSPGTINQTAPAGWLGMLPLGESPTGEVWFQRSPTQLNYYHPGAARFYACPLTIRKTGEIADARSIQSFLIDRTQLLWVGSFGKGIFKQSRVTHFESIRHQPYVTNSLLDDEVHYIYEAPSEPSVWWIGTRKGLDRYDRRTGRFTHYVHDPNQPTSLTPGIVFAIVEDRKGRLWVGTENGLCLLNRRTGGFIRFTHSLTSAQGLSNNRIRSLAVDRKGKLWVGTGEGLNAFEPDTGQFTCYDKADTTYHPQLYKYLYRLALPQKQVAAILRPGNQVNARQTFTVSAPTRVAIVSMGELGPKTRYDFGWIEDSQGRTVWEQTDSASRYAGGYMYQRIQVATLTLPAGNYRLRYQSDGADAYRHWRFPAPTYPEWWGIRVLGINQAEGDSLNKLVRRKEFNGLTSPVISVMGGILEDAKGKVWVGTVEGVSRLDPATSQFTHYADPTNGLSLVCGITEDSKQRLWIADYLNGLFQFDLQKGTFRRYTTADGLPVNSVGSILEDSQGLLWLSTFNGLCRFNPATNRLQHYSAQFGLAGNIFRARAIKATNGQLVFGGEHGLSILNPAHMVSDTFPPKVVLTDLAIFGQKAAIGPEAPLSADISLATQIRLAHDQNEVTFFFAAPHFTRSPEVTYAYRLENYDKDWIQAGTMRQARYTALSPGTYTFRVKAANADGIWSREETSIKLKIAPPWWQTWWAYLLYGLLTIGALRGYILYRSRTLRRQNRLLEEKVALRTQQIQKQKAEIVAQKEEIETQRDNLEQTLSELQTTQQQLIQKEKLASLGELTAGIAHEIQNPLNFVNNLTEVSQELVEELREERKKADRDEDLEEELLTDLEESLQKVSHHGKRADSIVKGMLQHSRAGSGEKQPTDLNALADEYLRLAYSGLRAKDQNFTADLRLKLDPNLQRVNIAPQEIGRVLLNLYNNAFYAVQEKAKTTAKGYQPQIEVTTHTQNGKVELRVRDNGTGIPKELLNKIYQPFFTTKPTGQGTGLGLSLSYDIVTKGHGGEMQVQTKEGEGTEFRVVLPVQIKEREAN